MKKIGKAIARKFKNWKGATNAKGDDIEESRAMPADVEEVKVEIKKQTNTVDKATETGTQLCNKNSETGQPIFESSEKAQNDSVVTIAGVVLGVAIAVYLETLAVGIAVGACCLVAAATIYYCNRPSSSLGNSNVQGSCKEVQEPPL
ncbi:hypothetical protein [Wolbachia endosymbiont (group A) of Clivina fossor]|uniref:TomO hydrophobic C-terminal domain-containing protein n=1 Tax=Wolbachia endosymbiont (group A) of Clivina fossor TaxID=3066133 RepID=UPI00313304A7